MVAIDVRKDFVSTPQRPSRILKTLRPPPPKQSFQVMTDGKYLVYAAIPDTDHPDVHPEWTLRCYDLNKKEEEASIIALHEFLPRGRDCWFKLIDRWVYAICATETGPFNERDRETKLYHNCCRFPIDNFGPAKKPDDFSGPSEYKPLPARLQAIQIPRGVGKDPWNRVCCGIVQDESTGNIFIAESADATLTKFYTPHRPITFPDPDPDPKKYTMSSWATTISDVVIVQAMEEDPSSSSQQAQQSSRSPLTHVQPGHSIMDVTYKDLVHRSDKQVLEFRATSYDRGVWQFLHKSAPQELHDYSTISEERDILEYSDERSLIVLVMNRKRIQDMSVHCQLSLVTFDSGINIPGCKPLVLNDLSDNTKDGKDTTKTKRLRKLQLQLLLRSEKERKSNITTREAETIIAGSGVVTEQRALHQTLGQGSRLLPSKASAE